MEDFLYNTNIDDTNVTPESLAWKLLMDDNVKDYAAVILAFVSNDDVCNKNNERYDDLAGQFEILITIYMEMIFGLLKINHVNQYINEQGELKNDVDLNKSFKPDFSNFGIDDLKNCFRDKMKKIRVFLSAQTILDANDNNPGDFGSMTEYYCKILLKDTEGGKSYFLKNSKNLDPEKRYTFVIRNDTDKKQKKLNDFYAVCALPNMKVRISFSPV